MENFTGIDNAANDSDVDYVYANPLIRGRYNEISNIDVKMETGTGKTYVYTRLMVTTQPPFGAFFNFTSFIYLLFVNTEYIKQGGEYYGRSKNHFSYI